MEKVEAKISSLFSKHPNLTHRIPFPSIDRNYVWRKEERLKPPRGALQVKILKQIARRVRLGYDTIKQLALQCDRSLEKDFPDCLNALEDFHAQIKNAVFIENKETFEIQSSKQKRSAEDCFQKILLVQSYLNTRSFAVCHPKPILFWDHFDVISSFKISNAQDAHANNSSDKSNFVQIGYRTVQTGEGRPQLDGCNLDYCTPLSVWYFRTLEAICCDVNALADFHVISHSEDIEKNYVDNTTNYRCFIHQQQQASLEYVVDFSSMLATPHTDSNSFACVELKRQQIGWFYLQDCNWVHFQQPCMQSIERWYLRNEEKKGHKPREEPVNSCLTRDHMSAQGVDFYEENDEYEDFQFTEGEKIWRFHRDAKSGLQYAYYGKQNLEKNENGKLMHREVLSEVCGDVVLNCAMWPLLQIENAKICRIMHRPCQSIFQDVWKSYVLVDFPSSLHRPQQCPCDPKSNLLNIIHVLLVDIGPAVSNFVELFMQNVHSDLMALFKRKFANYSTLSDLAACFDVPIYDCPSCSPKMVYSKPESSGHEAIGVKAKVLQHVKEKEEEDPNLSPDEEVDSTFYENPEQDTSFLASECSRPLCWVAHLFRSLHCGERVAWGNSSPRKWLAEDAYRHIGKLFCSIGHFASKFSSELDSANLMNVLIFCKAFHQSSHPNCWWRSPSVTIPSDVSTQARSVRNHVMHLPCTSSGLDCQFFQMYLTRIQVLAGKIFEAASKSSSDSSALSDLLKQRSFSIIGEFNKLYPELQKWLLRYSLEYQFSVPFIQSVDINGLHTLEKAVRKIYFLLLKPCSSLEPVRERHTYMELVLRLLRECTLIRKFIPQSDSTWHAATWGSKAISILDAAILNTCHLRDKMHLQ
jgi:hypothetical protein